MIKVAVGIIFQNGHGRRVLLCQRRPDVKYPLKWEFPGGKVEEGERTEACLERELGEELGISVSGLRLYDRRKAVYPDSGSYEVFYYMPRAWTGEMNNRVFNACEWVDVGDILGYDILEGNREVIERLQREFNGAAG